MGGDRRPAFRLAAVGLVVAVVSPVASGLASVAGSRNVPAQLVGQWSRRVSLADLKRANTGVIPPVVPVGTTCTTTIKTSGALRLACRNLGTYNGQLVPAGANRFYVKVSDPERNVYRWKVSGQSLTLTKITDPISDRVAVLWGVWKRK
jgi:hypothetical protein